jgi:hypothetical protein
MDLELNNSTKEINRLQHCIHDLVALLALPPLWSGAEPSQILEILLDALLPMVCLDFISGRVKDPVADTPVEVIRVAPSCNLKPDEIREMLNDWFEGDGQKSLPAIRKRFGDKGISIFPVPLDVRGETGMILVGSSRADFPGQTESLLLSVAANQASIGLKEAWLLNEQIRAANQLENLKKLEHECSLRGELDATWAVRPLALSQYNDRRVLVLEDPGGDPLNRLIQGPMEMEQFLRIAISLADALNQLHKRELIQGRKTVQRPGQLRDW